MKEVRFRKLSMEELGRLSAKMALEATRYPVHIVLDRVRSRYNVGAIFRNADAFRVAKIWLCGETPCPPHREIEKTALGSTESVPWEHVSDTALLLKELKKQNILPVAIEQTHQSQPLECLSEIHAGQIAFVFGHEVYGIGEEVLQECSYALEIPQYGHKHSFNVSVSTGIVLWEWYRSFVKKR